MFKKNGKDTTLEKVFEDSIDKNFLKGDSVLINSELLELKGVGLVKVRLEIQSSKYIENIAKREIERGNNTLEEIKEHCKGNKKNE